MAHNFTPEKLFAKGSAAVKDENGKTA